MLSSEPSGAGTSVTSALSSWKPGDPYCHAGSVRKSNLDEPRNSKGSGDSAENVSHLSNCCCLPACWAWSSGETSDWNLNTPRVQSLVICVAYFNMQFTIVERLFVYSNKAMALLTAWNVTRRNTHPRTDSQLLWSQTVARLADPNTHA